MPQSPQLEALSAELRRLYEQAWKRIKRDEAALLDNWAVSRRQERLARLRELAATVEQLMENADALALRFTRQNLPESYLLGANLAATALNEAALFTAVDVDAVNQLANDTYSELLTATRHVRSTTKTLIRTLAREHLGDKLTRGLTAVQAARNLRDSLAAKDISAVTYRNGARHGLADYTDMLARTKTGEAYQIGGLNQARAFGIGWVEIFDGSGCGLTSHNDPQKANGLILPLEEAARYPLAHPRCGRTTSPRPDVTSAAQARRATPSTTVEQRADQAAAEQAREQAMAAQRARQRMVRRRDGTFATERGSPAQARFQARLQART